MRKSKPEFDVALSFAGEDRVYVKKVADILRQMGFRVFYDKYETVSLWGKDLYTHLRSVYFERARYTVIFISRYYKKKLWSNHERESAQARAFQEHKEYVLPARFDNTQIPGILPTTGYVDLKEISPAKLSQMIKEKIGPIEREAFFPENPDRLYKYLDAPRKAKKQREQMYTLANVLFDSLKLMTPSERNVLSIVMHEACPAGWPNNAHLRLDYLSRLTSRSNKELISLFSRLDCLNIEARVCNKREHGERGKLNTVSEVIEIRYKPRLETFIGNATPVMFAVFKCIFDNLCPGCAKRAIEMLDLSVLSTLAGFGECSPNRRVKRTV